MCQYEAEEAPLTGESVPVNKTADVLTCDDQKTSPSRRPENMVYMEPIVYGRDVLSTGTGMNTRWVRLQMPSIRHRMEKLASAQTEPAQQDLKFRRDRHLCFYLCPGYHQELSGYQI